MDSWPPNAFSPLAAHRYAYCENDPASRIDPHGLFSSIPFGNLVHYLISKEFEGSGPGRISNLGVSTLVGSVIPFFGRWRPDLIDNVSRQIYEIKTVREAPIGFWKLEGYLLMMNWSDPVKAPPWTAGTPESFTPESPIHLPMGFTVVVFPPVHGVIAYDVFNFPLAFAGLAALAISSRAADGARLTAQLGTAVLIASFGIGL